MVSNNPATTMVVLEHMRRIPIQLYVQANLHPARALPLQQHVGIRSHAMIKAVMVSGTGTRMLLVVPVISLVAYVPRQVTLAAIHNLAMIMVAPVRMISSLILQGVRVTSQAVYAHQQETRAAYRNLAIQDSAMARTTSRATMPAAPTTTKVAIAYQR